MIFYRIEFFSISSHLTQSVGDTFRICSLVFRKVSDVSRPPTLYSRQSIICLNEEVKSSAAFLMFAKHLTLFGLTVCFFKLFTELGINGRMWLAIKDLYTNVKARVLYSGSLSRMFGISPGTGQGRILAPFMYKVYINSLLNVLSNHCYAIFISDLSLSCPSFADDISLITLHASFLQSLMTKCFRYSLQWRYEFNHTKTGVVTFGESKPSHLVAM